MDERIAMQIGRRARGTTIRQLLAVLGHDARSRLEQITLPTLIMKPGQDILVRADASDRLARDIPDTQLVTFPHSGHGLIFQEAESVNAHIKRHVSDNE